jgi:hypothetical protein
MQGYTEKREINGNVYQVSRLPFTQMLETLADCGRLVGGSVENLVQKLDSMPATDLLAIISHLVGRLDGPEAKKIRESLGGVTMVTNRALDTQYQELWFIDNARDFWPWLAFALEVNYKDFLGGIINILPQAVKGKLDTLVQKKSRFPFQSTSIGGFGDQSKPDMEA